MAVAREGHGVQPVHDVDHRLVEFAAVKRPTFDARLTDAAPLATKLLALLRSEAREKIVK